MKKNNFKLLCRKYEIGYLKKDIKFNFSRLTQRKIIRKERI